ncbi:hypothetical protein D3C87_2133040 [compost metagenome]
MFYLNRIQFAAEGEACPPALPYTVPDLIPELFLLYGCAPVEYLQVVFQTDWQIYESL